MTDTEDKAMTGQCAGDVDRIITHDEAHESAQRLINSHFRKEPHARVGIPARPGYDDDLIICQYIRQQRACTTPPAPQAGNIEQVLINAKLTSRDGTYVSAPTRAIAAALRSAQAPARTYADGIEDALRDLIIELENGQNHDEGAFDDSCPVCIILAKLRALTNKAP